MGGFASSAFSVMLAWVRTAAAWLWNLTSGDTGSGFLVWIGAHWKLLAIALCVIGLAIDWAVYLLRWKPYRVWASFFRRLRGEYADTSSPAAPKNPAPPAWEPAEAPEEDSSLPPEQEPEPAAAAVEAPFPADEIPAPRRRRRQA